MFTEEEVKAKLEEYFKNHSVEELLDKIYSDEFKNETENFYGVHPTSFEERGAPLFFYL